MVVALLALQGGPLWVGLQFPLEVFTEQLAQRLIPLESRAQGSLSSTGGEGEVEEDDGKAESRREIIDIAQKLGQCGEVSSHGQELVKTNINH